jgi:Subtilase family
LSPAPPPTPGAPLSPLAAAEQAAAGGSAAEQSAVQYALDNGVILVAPAGDNGAGTDAPNFPADYPGVISVGAFDSSFHKAAFSSHEPYVTLTAAGSGMTAAIPPDGYTSVSSTAAASAIVTGIVALIKSQYPELTPAQVTRALTTSTVFRPAGGMTDGSGHGSVDAKAALAAAASIAAPGPHRADAGAVSSQSPATPPVPVIDTSLTPKLERDALISAALLVVLLLPIAGYAIVRWRRRAAKPPAPARAEHDLAGRGGYPLSGETRADPMLRYFAASPAQPEADPGSRPARGPGAAGSRSVTASGGPGSGYTLGARAPSGTFADAGVLRDDHGRRLGSQVPRSPLTPVTRATTARPPKVSGSPPWDPAPKPDTELPWAKSPPPALGRRTPLLAPPESSAWGATADTGKPPAAENGRADGDGTDPGAKPIYVWNPSANTETFPSVPGEGD